MALVPGQEYHHLCLTSSWLSLRETKKRMKNQGLAADHERLIGLEPAQYLPESPSSVSPLEINLFASRLTNKRPADVSWRPDPEEVQTNVFAMSWKGQKVYANPPWNSIARFLGQVRQQERSTLLVAPECGRRKHGICLTRLELLIEA